MDDSVRRISTTYDDVGRVQTVSTYDAEEVGQGAVLNQVKYAYNGWGRVAQEFQEHDGEVGPASLHVDYVYEDGATAGVARYVRLDQVIYPNGRQVHYGYGTSEAIDGIMSRPAFIGDGTNTHVSYKYLGAARIVREDYADIDVKLDYAADNLAALDRFGRVADQLWTDYGAHPDAAIDEYTYTYDRAGNRTSRNNTLHAVFDETYAYDAVDRLTSSNRADNFDQSWTLDGLGNFGQFDDDGSSQTRATNPANEIQNISGGWATPAYDRAGNMTTIPSPLPGDADRALGAKYDAWNRLVEVSDGGILLARFSYDGTGRRIEQLNDFVEGTPQDATHYFLNGQQVIETREGSPASSAESLQPKYQSIWSARYIDSLVLRDEYSSGVLQSSSRLYYLNDANYNVTALVDVSGDVVERYAYSAYGKATIYTPDWSATRASSLYGNTTLYTGRELDLATGLYYHRARYYSADLGTFVNRDPLMYEAGDFNLYRYCGNNPLLRTDPTGEDWLDCMSACIQDNDPLPYALGAAVKGVLALGGWQSKSALAAIAGALGNEKLAEAIMKAQKLFANQQPVTDLLSLISMGGKGANKAAWQALRQVGGKVAAVLGPLQIGYGLALAAIETHCMGYCCTASWYGIPYDPVDGNVIKAWKDYYF